MIKGAGFPGTLICKNKRMRNNPSIIALLLLFVGACTEEHDIQRPVIGQETEQTAATGIISVKLSEELAGEIEKGGNLPCPFEIKSMERIFPDAGEFEARSRAEGLHLWYHIEYDAGTATTRAASDLLDIPGVEISEIPQKIKNTAVFNDPYFMYMWHLYDSKTPTASINVVPVWQTFTSGSSSIIVGVVDGGIQTDHPDLEGRVIPGGINGSKNFVNNSFNITADSHGTHVGGTIGAINNNGTGVCGIAGGDAAKGIEGVRLLSCQIFSDAGGNGDSSAAIKWAADHGACIVNNSWGYDYDANDDGKLTGDELDKALAAKVNSADKAAIDYFIKYAGFDADGNQTGPMAGGVVFFAAGNEGISNGAPANYEPVIAVGATDSNGRRAYFSNYGPWVDIAAPGMDIYSTYPTNTYTTLQGTSMACPHVTGVAALLLSYYGGKGFTNEELKDKLLGGANADVLPASSQIGPFLDAMGSFTYSSPEAPDAITDISTSASGNTITLDFTTTGNADGIPAYSFVAAASEDRAKIESFDPFSAVPEGVIKATLTNNGVKVGEKIQMKIQDLNFEGKYYLRIYAVNYIGRYSAPSAVLEQETFRNNPPSITALDEGPYDIKASEVRKIRFSVEDPDSHAVNLAFDGGSDAADYSFDGSSGILTVTVRGKRAPAGSYSASITASDRYDGSSTITFGYTILENQAPVTVKTLEDILRYGKDESIEISLSGCFEDPEGETLSYKVRGANSSLVKTSFKGDRMTIVPQAFGYSQLTVVATDPGNKECTSPLRILIKDESNPAECFPNPVSDILNIRTEEEVPTHVGITDANGVSVFDRTLTIGGFSPAAIDMGKCAPGQYRLVIEYSGKKFRKTIIKK